MLRGMDRRAVIETLRKYDAALRAGFDACISKPVLPDELIARVNEILSSREEAKRLPLAGRVPGRDGRDPARE